ncbi:MAG: hypothetical protein K0S74_1547 [Chlamydiales bacterium]|jgi:hypothetical protein|nr:hypothetical protein [Chlamydiales bacterium]
MSSITNYHRASNNDNNVDVPNAKKIEKAIEIAQSFPENFKNMAIQLKNQVFSEDSTHFKMVDLLSHEFEVLKEESLELKHSSPQQNIAINKIRQIVQITLFFHQQLKGNIQSADLQAKFNSYEDSLKRLDYKLEKIHQLNLDEAAKTAIINSSEVLNNIAIDISTEDETSQQKTINTDQNVNEAKESYPQVSQIVVHPDVSSPETLNNVILNTTTKNETDHNFSDFLYKVVDALANLDVTSGTGNKVYQERSSSTSQMTSPTHTENSKQVKMPNIDDYKSEYGDIKELEVEIEGRKVTIYKRLDESIKSLFRFSKGKHKPKYDVFVLDWETKDVFHGKETDYEGARKNAVKRFKDKFSL